MPSELAEYERLARTAAAGVDRRAIRLAADVLDRRLSGATFGGGATPSVLFHNISGRSSGFDPPTAYITRACKISRVTLFSGLTPLVTQFDFTLGRNVSSRRPSWGTVELKKAHAPVSPAVDPPLVGNNPIVSMTTGAALAYTVGSLNDANALFISTPFQFDYAVNRPAVTTAKPIGIPASPSTKYVLQLFVQEQTFANWYSLNLAADDLLYAAFSSGGGSSDPFATVSALVEF